VVLSKRTCRLDEIAAECIRKEKHVAEAKGISIQLKVDPGMEFFGDGEKIGSVVTILLDNAIKYSFERTMVGVELFRLRETALCLRVTNSGPGISHEDALHVFDRFFRASATRTVNSGSGLGLAIARSIIELHAGTIVVESVPNEKTVFTVSLPNIPPARQAAS
jgi:signal transduction histidine kinase